MTLNFKEIATASMILFAVIDIVGSVPIIIDLRKKVGHIQSEKASIVAAVIMIVFLFLERKYLISLEFRWSLLPLLVPSYYFSWHWK